MTTQPSSDQIWQALLRFTGNARTPHFHMDASSRKPLRELLRSLGEPQSLLRAVHIAGSKGKGSTALYLERLLRAHGERVATFTSPHLQHWRERFRIDGMPVADHVLLPVAQRVLALAAAQPSAAALRPFDLLTAIAMTLFADSPSHWTLLEAGVGGRFDATNVAEPALCVLTHIELEHCDVLGDSLARIAAQKAGIIKPAIPVICATLPREAQDVVTHAANKTAAPMLQAGRGFDYRCERVAATTWRTTFHGQTTLTFDLTAGAQAQVENAALALAACETLGVRLDPVTVGDVFTRALPARCELLPGTPAILLDAAHTPASLRALRETMEAIPHRRRHILAACSSERHLDALTQLFAGAHRVVVTRADSRYTVAPERLLQAVRLAHPHLDVTTQPDVEDALDEAAADLGQSDLVCVTGSTYLVGRTRALLVKEHSG